MPKNYLYIRLHSSYNAYNAVKLGITTCIGSRDTSYATGEIKRGKFINVFEITNFPKKYLLSRTPLIHIEKEIHIYLKQLDKHIYIDGGKEFFSCDIISLIPSFLDSLGIEYITLSDDTINKLIDEYRFNNFYSKLSSGTKE